jgi:transposase
MAGKDIVCMSQKELKRLHVVHKIVEGSLTQAEAAGMISLSIRQVRRIVKRIKTEGDKGVQHRSRGRESNRRTPKELVERVLQLYREKYQGFGPTLTAEKLGELDGIEVSRESIRTWLMGSGQWQKRRKGRKHRNWRERKGHCGQMLQLDGSLHDWFEGRRDKCVLMAYIDDATNRISCRFYEYEGTIPAMDSFKRYIRRYGIPMSIYLDKHTTYKSPAAPTIEEELSGTTPLSEFGRALAELEVEIIHAHSPQAKGRIERLFNTLQDRLVKEMTLRGISTIEEANRYLGTYLSFHNKRFAVRAKEQEDLHREVPEGLDLDDILCIRTVRPLRNDFTITHRRKLYQIETMTSAKKVTVQERVNGSMLVTAEGIKLRFREILERPQTPEPPSKRRRSSAHAPSHKHPWITSNGRLFRKMRGQSKQPVNSAS